MPKTFSEISEIMLMRREARSPLLEKMAQVAERYNGDWVVPDLGDEASPMTPALVAEAVDHLGLRASSVQPAIYCPALEAGKDTGKRSTDFALRRRKALYYSWDCSAWTIASGRAFRHLAGYATSALVVVPDFDYGAPKLLVRDPLHAYPEPKAAEDLSPVGDCGFIYGKSADWISAHYPQAADHVRYGTRGEAPTWDMVEWIDHDEIVVGLLGPRDDIFARTDHTTMRPLELRRWANKAGRCTALIPERVTMDRIASQVANVVGHSDLMAKLLALDIIASEKATFPDRYIIGQSGRTPQLVGGTWKDGRTGEVNVILDAQDVGDIRGTPDPVNKITQDRIERNFRTSVGLVPQFGGETYGALRTGRGIDALMAAAVDPRIYELHKIMELNLTRANEVVLDAYKGYWPTKKYTVFSGLPSDDTLAEFTPSEHMETAFNKVAYPIPGADFQATTIILGQMVGAGFLSEETAREKHPLVENPEAEARKRLVEALTRAAQEAHLQRAAAGEIADIDDALMIDLIEQGWSWHKARLEVDRRARERQATIAPPAEPGQIAAPEAMPGLANPGIGAESPIPPPIAGPNDAQANLRQLVNALRSGATQAA